MANYKGTRLMLGEKWSVKYPGMIEKDDGWLRKPIVWVNPRGKTQTANSYYKEMECVVCKKITLKDKSNFKRYANAVCSIDCKTKLRTKPNGTKTYKRGKPTDYVLVKDPSHPFANRQGMVLEHRLVMEKHIGRLLKKEEQVHHINLIKNDNNINNLVLFENQSSHIDSHKSLNSCISKLINSGVLKFNKKTNTYEIS